MRNDICIDQREIYQPKKIEELESIRGLAALLIVFGHIPKWNPVCYIPVVDNGSLMVELFFVLSGFVLFNAYGDKIFSIKDLVRFQFLRFGRLYPVHLLFLIVFLFFEFAKYIFQVKYGIISPNSVPFERNNFTAFIQNILLVQSVLPNSSQTFNYPSWSISVEFYTYLIFGLGVLYFKRLKIHFFALFAIISTVLLVSGFTLGFGPMFRCTAGFFIGCMTAQLIKNRKIISSGYKWLSIAMFFLIVVFLQTRINYDTNSYMYFLGSALISSLILVPDGWLNRVLKFRVFTWLGTISYSVYMSHPAIEWVANQIVRVLLKRPEAIGINGYSTPQLSVTETFIAYAVILSVVLITSTLVYTYFEKPLRDKSRSLAYSKLN
ncbi:acyltransferase [Chlorobium sp. KB01]|uniref:acyltransferase family protein n=1 Tax=Chlorobium sp. KB01 TaxID=1917528 RepID=UPI0009786DD1|nr:acyltransferase [Chlorobium sp. KB01]